MSAAVDLSGMLAAVWHGDPPAGSQVWNLIRAGGITGTDVAAIVGESRRRNALTVWHAKRGTAVEESDPGEAADWGNILEPVVAAEWARRHGGVLAGGGLFSSREAPWMRVQVDSVVAVCPDTPDQDHIVCALEIKTRNQFVAGKWRDELPDDVLAQVAWQRLVLGLDHVHVACLIGGQRLVEYTYHRDDKLEAYLAASAAEVWTCVVDDVPPEVEWNEILNALLDVIVPDRSGTRELDATEAAQLLTVWAAKQAAEDAALKLKAAAEAKVKQAFGLGLDGVPAAETLSYGGDVLFSYREQGKQSIPVAELEGNDVELYERVLSGGHINHSRFRVLRGPKRDDA